MFFSLLSWISAGEFFFMFWFLLLKGLIGGVGSSGGKFGLELLSLFWLFGWLFVVYEEFWL
jgi:hypothetical protein